MQARTGGSESALRGLTDFIRAAADPDRVHSDAALMALIDSAPEPVGFRWGLERLDAVATIRTTPPADFSDAEVEEYQEAQAELLRRIGRESGDPVSGPVEVARNVLEQFARRWF